MEAPVAIAAAPPPLPVLPPVDPGPDGSVPITRVPSPANQTIVPLPPVDPGPVQSVAIDRAPVVFDPAVEPSPLTLPLHPAQELIDAASNNALASLGAASPSFVSGGLPDLDPAKLQPQVPSAAPTAGPPRMTYRICAETATRPVTCTELRPVGAPHRIDVTGDGTVDVVAQLIPGPSPVTVAVLSVSRLRASETTGGPLRAHVWAVFDLPSTKRLSVGFDGFRRGTTLPATAFGVFTVDDVAAAAGGFDVRGSLRQSGAGASMAVTMGLASVAPDAVGSPFDPTVASVQFSPVPSVFDAHSVVDLADEEGSIDTTTDRTSRLDAIVVSRRGGGAVPFGRFTQLVVDQLPTSLSASLARPPAGGAAALRYQATSPTTRLAFSDFEYLGFALDRSLTTVAQGVPAAIDLSFVSSLGPAATDVAFDHVANARTTSLDAGIFDRPAASFVARAVLDDVPSDLSLAVDLPDGHVSFVGNDRLGSGEAFVSRGLGSFAPLDGDHATLGSNGTAMGASARVTGLRSVDVFVGAHPRATVQFDPGGQPFVAAGDINGIVKSRIEIADLPASLAFDLDPTARMLGYDASSEVSQVNAAFLKTDTGPTVAVAVTTAPTILGALWNAGEQSELSYIASSAIPRLEFFASPDPIETLRPDADHYLSVLLTDAPPQGDLAVDFPARHLEGVFSAPLSSLVAHARVPVAGDVFSVAAIVSSVPAHFDASFGDGAFRVRGLSGPIGSANVAVTNHTGTTAPTGQHLAVRFREVTGDFDASVRIRNLSHVEYSRGVGAQTFRLDGDTEGEPLPIDADVVLAANGVDDTRLGAVGRVVGLPTTLTFGLDAGRLTAMASSPVSLLAEMRVGKVAALAGLGAPLFDHGVAVAARSCAPGPGCATDTSPACVTFSSCFGVVATVQMSGPAPSTAVDLGARSVQLSGWEPAGPLQTYIRLLGLVPSVPEAEVLATIDGLPSPLDVTLGPVALGDSGVLDVAVTASAPIGSLAVAVEAHDTPSLGTLRGEVTASPPPAALHVTGRFGSVTGVTVDNSAAVGALTAKVTGVSTGYLSAALTDVPTQVDLNVDLADRHAQSTASSAIGAMSLLARVPFSGRTWGVFALMTGVPTEWDADFGDGTLRVSGLSGSIGSAEFAIANHSGATVPAGRHLAGHYRQLTGDLDTGLRVTNLAHVELTRTTVTSTFRLDSGPEPVVLDSDSLLATNGLDDTRFAVVAHLDTPNTLHVTLGSGTLTFHPDQPADLLAEARIGKASSLVFLDAPLFPNGVATRGLGCTPGPGCATDTTPVCTTIGRCFGLVSTVNLPGLPSEVVVDFVDDQVTIDGYQPPTAPLQVFRELEDMIATVPRTAALAALTGLPASLDLTLGPFNFEPGDITEFHVDYTGSASIGELEVEAEADTTTTFGDLRGHARLSPVPESTSVSSEFGSFSDIRAAMSSPVNILSMQVTGLLQGNPASGLAAFTNVPAEFDFDLTGFADEALGVPEITYNGHGSNTLDGLVQVDADLIEAFSTGGVSIPVAGGDAWARITNLGSFTTVQTNPDRSVNLASFPETDELSLGGIIESSVATIPLNLQVFDQNGFTGTLVGHVGAPTIHIGDLELAIRGLRSMRLSPSQVTYLTTGVEGDYDELSIFADDMLIDPDVELTLEIDGPLFLDGSVVMSIQDPFTGVRFHVADQVLRESACVAFEAFGVGTGHVRVFTKPGKIGTGINQITLFGANGPQALNYLDPVPTPLGTDPDLVSLAIDLITVYVTDPFGDSEAEYDPDFGGC